MFGRSCHMAMAAVFRLWFPWRFHFLPVSFLFSLQLIKLQHLLSLLPDRSLLPSHFAVFLSCFRQSVELFISMRMKRWAGHHITTRRQNTPNQQTLKYPVQYKLIAVISVQSLYHHQPAKPRITVQSTQIRNISKVQWAKPTPMSAQFIQDIKPKLATIHLNKLWKSLI